MKTRGFEIVSKYQGRGIELPQRKTAASAGYDLQAALYLLALHRHLRERLPDYDCTRHLGGAVYLFLRGWDGAGQGVWHACPDAAHIDALDALFAGQPLPGADHADL